MLRSFEVIYGLTREQAQTAYDIILNVHKSMQGAEVDARRLYREVEGSWKETYRTVAAKPNGHQVGRLARNGR